MRWLILIFLCMALTVDAATTYTEFYCDNSIASSNVFAGSTTSATPAYSSFAGNWDGTSVYTPTDNTTPANSVNVGDWASVYADGAVVAVYVARVLTVAAGVNGAITLSTTAIAGTSPSSSANARTIRVGGCWHGPGTRDILGGQGGSTNYFPFDFAVQTLTNTAVLPPRVNFKAGTTYAITNAITHSKSGPLTFSGYTSSPGDGGRATIDGGTAVAYYIILTVSGNENILQDFIFSNNGGSGSAASGISLSGRTIVYRCVAHNIRQSGFASTSACSFIEDEAYLCNQANAASSAGFTTGGSGNMFERCISHDNSGSNASGYQWGGGNYLYFCIADSNGGNGVTFSSGSTGGSIIYGSDFYNNGNGISLGQTAVQAITIENCNFIKQSGSGITGASAPRGGYIINCGFGTGSQANNTADVGPLVAGLNVINSISYASGVTPWVDPANGDFRINLTAAKAAGRGAFTETQAAYAGTVGFPDVGAAQSASTNGGFGATFAQ